MLALDFFPKVLSPNTLIVTKLKKPNWPGILEAEARLIGSYRPAWATERGQVCYPQHSLSGLYSVLSRNEMRNLFSMGLINTDLDPI